MDPVTDLRLVEMASQVQCRKLDCQSLDRRTTINPWQNALCTFNSRLATTPIVDPRGSRVSGSRNRGGRHISASKLSAVYRGTHMRTSTQISSTSRPGTSIGFPVLNETAQMVDTATPSLLSMLMCWTNIVPFSRELRCPAEKTAERPTACLSRGCFRGTLTMQSLKTTIGIQQLRLATP